MISIIIPTYNRRSVLQETLGSYYTQKDVSEVVIVDDCSEDDTEGLIKGFKKKYPHILTIYIKQKKRQGAAKARNIGFKHCSSPYIFYGEDDVILGENYCSTLLSKLQKASEIAVMSGRIIHMKGEETIAKALERFGNGLNSKPLYSPYLFLMNPDANFQGDKDVPLTHAVMMTRRGLLEKYSYDECYCRGNGFREESTFQARAFVKGHRIVMTNETHCYHLHRNKVQDGGQRCNVVKVFFWKVYYNNKFLNSFYEGYKKRLNLKRPCIFAKALFWWKSFFDLFYQIIPPKTRSVMGRVKRKILGNIES
jgi:glycosyltransferase involved in cell wall biosynthesis